MLLFDGTCNLCNVWVLFFLQNERSATVRFASLQSDAGRQMLAAHGLDPDALDTIVLIEDGRAHVRSTAVLRAARWLRPPWASARVLLIVPRPFRDPVYDVVARWRYRVFGRRESCMVPSEPVRRRFLDQV